MNLAGSENITGSNENISGNNENNPVNNELNSAGSEKMPGSSEMKSGRLENNSVWREKHSALNAKNIPSASYVTAAQNSPAPVISGKSRPAGLLSNKRMVFLFTETKTKP